MTDYTPIDCALYSDYEHAIIHRQRLRVCWQEPGGQPRIEVCTPLDLLTRDHEEFLVIDTGSGQHQELRLDFIRQIKVL